LVANFRGETMENEHFVGILLVDLQLWKCLCHGLINPVYLFIYSPGWLATFPFLGFSVWGPCDLCISFFQKKFLATVCCHVWVGTNIFVAVEHNTWSLTGKVVSPFINLKI